MSPLSSFLRFFFHYLYHELAWTYDLVASVVSLGRWNRWIEVAVPCVRGHDILEVGFGRGHLQEQLLIRSDLRVFALDESLQMARLARRHLRGDHRVAPPKLARGRAQLLPYPEGSFDTVVSTFPSEYISDPSTLAEIRRVLRAAGRLVIIPAASIVGRGTIDRAAAWLFRVTHQAPASPGEALSRHLGDSLQAAGFHFRLRTVEMASSVVYVVEADRSDGPA